MVEACPVETGGASYGYVGSPDMYERVGFETIARAAARGAVPRRVMRLTIARP